jgi:ABC-2 type transport system permease protein
MNLLPLMTKEIRELVKSYKLLFVPIAYILLAAMQPLAFHFMPLLLKSAGNLPPGFDLNNIPVPPPGQVIAAAVSQFNQLGVLLIVLCSMGAIATERASGVAATVLSKPVGRGEYLLAKAIAYTLLSAVSLLGGLYIGAYYTWLLIGPVDWAAVTQAYLLYLPFLILAAAVTLFFSTFLPSPLATAGAALVTMVVLSTVPKYLGQVISRLGPGALTEMVGKVLLGSASGLTAPVVGVTVLVVLFLVAGWRVLRTQEI